MIVLPKDSQCLRCAHYRGIQNDTEEERNERPCCDAFPSGIAPDIILNRIRHDKPILGDGGIQFRAK